MLKGNPIVLSKDITVEPRQFDAAWEAAAPERGVYLKSNFMHEARGAVLFFPDPAAAQIRAELAGQVQAAEPKEAPP